MIPVISLVIPCHGRRDMIIELLSSLPDDINAEVILIDDHSPIPLRIDDDIRYATPLPTHIQQLSGELRYAGNARNAGLRMARGAFVMFVDSDDLIHTEGLRAAIDHLSTDFDAFYVLGQGFKDGGGEGRRHISPNFTINRAFKSSRIKTLVELHQPMFKIYRRQFIIESGAYFDGTQHANDVMFNARVHIKNPKTYFIPLIVPVIREGNSSLTSNSTKTSLDTRLSVQLRYNDLLRRNGLRRYQIPAINQAKHLYKIDRKAAISWMVKFWRSGQPVLATPYFTWKKILMKYRRDYHTP